MTTMQVNKSEKWGGSEVLLLLQLVLRSIIA